MKTIKKQYCKPSLLLLQAESVMAASSTGSTGSTGNLPIGGPDDSKDWVSRKNTGSSWTWTDDEGNENSWTNQ